MAKNTKQTTVHIDETLLKEVKRIGINENKSISQIINESIIDYILVYRENEDKEKNEHDKNLNEFKKEEEKRMQAKSAARAIAEAKKRVLY
ncbi:transcriptional regulator [Clostridioides difficile]